MGREAEPWPPPAAGASRTAPCWPAHVASPHPKPMCAHHTWLAVRSCAEYSSSSSGSRMVSRSLRTCGAHHAPKERHAGVWGSRQHWQGVPSTASKHAVPVARSITHPPQPCKPNNERKAAASPETTRQSSCPHQAALMQPPGSTRESLGSRAAACTAAAPRARSSSWPPEHHTALHNGQQRTSLARIRKQ